jgi:hypothetical protein
LIKAFWVKEIKSFICGANCVDKLFATILAKPWMRLMGLYPEMPSAPSFQGMGTIFVEVEQ